MSGARRRAATIAGVALFGWADPAQVAAEPASGSGQFTGGGGNSTSRQFSATGTIGQPVATTTASVGAGFASRSGLWAQSTFWLNSLPTLAGATNATIRELTAHVQNLVPQDPDMPAQPLVVRLLQGPSGLVVTNGVLAWTPAAAQGPSTNIVQVSVSDGVDSVTRKFSLIVLDSIVYELILNTPVAEADRFRFEILGTAGIRARLQRSLDLLNWVNVSAYTVPALVEVPASASEGFFRAVVEP